MPTQDPPVGQTLALGAIVCALKILKSSAVESAAERGELVEQGVRNYDDLETLQSALGLIRPEDVVVESTTGIKTCPLDGSVLGHDFGSALYFLKGGAKIMRKDWQDGSYLVVSAKKVIADHAATDEHRRQHGTIVYKRVIHARIDRMHVGDEVEVGWRPTSRDMLANDWRLV